MNLEPQSVPERNRKRLFPITQETNLVEVVDKRIPIEPNNLGNENDVVKNSHTCTKMIIENARRSKTVLYPEGLTDWLIFALPIASSTPHTR